MAERAKYLSGIGYILVLIGAMASITKFGGIITLAGIVLAEIAWILLGRKLYGKVMIRNGILMIVSPFLIAGIIIAVLISMSPHISEVSRYGRVDIMPEQIIHLVSIIALITLAVIAIGFVSWILHVMSHLRAGNKLAIGTFKYSAYCQIASFLISVASLAWLFSNIMKVAPLLQKMTKPNIFVLSNLLGPAFITLMIAGVISVVAYVLSIVAFFSIEEIRTLTF